MDHAEAARLMAAYESGTLGRPETKELHAHFKGCEACQSRIRLRRAMVGKGPQAPSLARSLADPETQKQIARNRDLLIKILGLGIAAWAVFKWHR